MRAPFIFFNRYTENIRLHFLIDLVGHYVDLVKYSFEVSSFNLSVIWVWKLTAYIIFNVFVSQNFRQRAIDFFILLLIYRILASLSRIFLTSILSHFLLRLQTWNLLQCGLLSIGWTFKQHLRLLWLFGDIDMWVLMVQFCSDIVGRERHVWFKIPA